MERWKKARIVAESADPEFNISQVVRRNGVSRGLLAMWRRLAGVSSSGALKGFNSAF
jgi:transposase